MPVRSRIACTGSSMRRPGVPRWLWVLGPGLMVMLADTDAGSVITASQSGARWGYRLLALQVLLVPVLYLVMELTVRLGIATGKGHAQLIRECFGSRWALVSIGDAAGERVRRAGDGVRWRRRRRSAVWVAGGADRAACGGALVALVVSGGYRRVELVGIALGLFELAFVAAAMLAHPSAHAIASGITSQPLGQPGYLSWSRPTSGRCMMPWMVFYQQGAVVDKRLRRAHLRLGAHRHRGRRAADAAGHGRGAGGDRSEPQGRGRARCQAWARSPARSRRCSATRPATYCSRSAARGRRWSRASSSRSRRLGGRRGCRQAAQPQRRRAPRAAVLRPRTRARRARRRARSRQPLTRPPRHRRRGRSTRCCCRSCSACSSCSPIACSPRRTRCGAATASRSASRRSSSRWSGSSGWASHSGSSGPAVATGASPYGIAWSLARTCATISPVTSLIDAWPPRSGVRTPAAVTSIVAL